MKHTRPPTRRGPRAPGGRNATGRAVALPLASAAVAAPGRDAVVATAASRIEVLRASMRMRWRGAVFAAAAALIALPAWAVDDPPAAPAGDPLAEARAHVAARQWTQAVAELRRVNQTRSADWHNLMGFALRQQSPPDLAGARQHYDAALRLDPKHKGALEYAGELDLMTGDLAAAEQRLQRLEAVCATGCEEHADLKAAIERFKAAGHRSQPRP